MKKKITQTKWSFEIGGLDYDLNDHGKPFKPVLLDKQVIYKIDKTKVYGNIERDQTKDVIAALKKKLKIEFSREDIQRALTIGILEKQ